MSTCNPNRRASALSVLALVATSGVFGQTTTASRLQTADGARTVRRFAAPEASQAVAVDDRFFYAIGNTVVAKYDKRTGSQVAIWRAEPGSHVAHLNSGIVVGKELFCAHSNYPETPMVSSIEVFDTSRMRHVRSVPLTDRFGSATWIDRAEGGWWITFANYAGKGGVPGRGPEATRLVRFSKDWRVRNSYSFPAAVVTQWGVMSSSGGVALTPRVFVTTGHDRPELYVVELPKTGDQLVLRGVVTVESEGQGIALDRRSRRLYSIQRRTREVLESALPDLARTKR